MRRKYRSPTQTILIVEWFAPLLPGPWQVTKIDPYDGCRYVYGGFPNYRDAVAYARKLRAELEAVEARCSERRRRQPQNSSDFRGVAIGRAKRPAPMHGRRPVNSDRN